MRSCPAVSELPLPLVRLGLPRGHVKARRLHRCRPPERPMRAQVLEYLYVKVGRRAAPQAPCTQQRREQLGRLWW